MTKSINPVRERIIRERNQMIWEYYTNEYDPMSMSKIARVMTAKGCPMSKANVQYAINKVRKEMEEQNESMSA